MAPKDITGLRFGQLTAINIVDKYNKTSIWRCLCDCGKYTDVRLGNLTSDNTTSCGCKRFKADICAHD